MLTKMVWQAASIVLVTLIPCINALSQELRNRKLPNCTEGQSWDNIKDKGKFWYNTGAERFADDYINSRPNSDHTDWAQDLLRELLPEWNHAEFSCQNTASACTVQPQCGTLAPLNMK